MENAQPYQRLTTICVHFWVNMFFEKKHKHKSANLTALPNSTRIQEFHLHKKKHACFWLEKSECNLVEIWKAIPNFWRHILAHEQGQKCGITMVKYGRNASCFSQWSGGNCWYQTSEDRNRIQSTTLAFWFNSKLAGGRKLWNMARMFWRRSRSTQILNSVFFPPNPFCASQRARKLTRISSAAAQLDEDQCQSCWDNQGAKCTLLSSSI